MKIFRFIFQYAHNFYQCYKKYQPWPTEDDTEGVGEWCNTGWGLESALLFFCVRLYHESRPTKARNVMFRLIPNNAERSGHWWSIYLKFREGILLQNNIASYQRFTAERHNFDSTRYNDLRTLHQWTALRSSNLLNISLFSDFPLEHEPLVLVCTEMFSQNICCNVFFFVTV